MPKYLILSYIITLMILAFNLLKSLYKIKKVKKQKERKSFT